MATSSFENKFEYFIGYFDIKVVLFRRMFKEYKHIKYKTAKYRSTGTHIK